MGGWAKPLELGCLIEYIACIALVVPYSGPGGGGYCCIVYSLYCIGSTLLSCCSCMTFWLKNLHQLAFGDTVMSRTTRIAIVMTAIHLSCGDVNCYAYKVTIEAILSEG